MALKVWSTCDLHHPDTGGHIAAVVVANTEEEAKFVLEQDLKNDDIKIRGEDGIVAHFTMQPVKITRPHATVLYYGDEL